MKAKKKPLEGKKIALGVTGSIAAYKACELCRLYIKAGAEVTVVMTDGARQFVTPLTFQTLSRNPVITALFEPAAAWDPKHVSLATWCDIAVVAPCTANVIAKMAHGLADDALSSFLLACGKPKLVAPAMNEGMLVNPATQANIATLRKRGITVMECTDGDLACAATGRGRLPEPADIFAATAALL